MTNSRSYGAAVAGFLFAVSILMSVHATVPELSKWGNPLRCEQKNFPGKLEITASDVNPRLFLKGLSLKTELFNTLVIRYSAKGLENATRGSLYFRAAGEKYFSEKNRIKFPLFNGDGAEHTVFLTLPEAWHSAGLVAELRLDPFYRNQPGARITFHEFSLICRTADDMRIWNATNEFAGWTRFERGSGKIAGGKLVFQIKDRNSRLYNENCNFSSTGCNTFEIRYRAEGLPEKTSGTLFFRPSGEHKYVAERRVRLPSLKADGSWHVLKLKLPDNWNEVSMIGGLRLDPADCAEKGTLEIDFIRVVHGPERVELKEPLWKNVKSCLPESSVSKVLPQPYWSGKMIAATGDDGKKPRTFVVWSEFSVPEKLLGARIQITADDRFALWIDDQLVTDRMNCHLWAEPYAADVSKFLKPGRKQRLIMAYYNVSGPGGVLFELSMMTTDGKVVKVVSDEKFSAALLSENVDLHKISSLKLSGNPVRTFAVPPAAPWKRVIPFEEMVRPLEHKMIRVVIPVSGKAGTVLPVKYEFAGAVTLPVKNAEVKFHSLPNRILMEKLSVPVSVQEKTAVLNIPLPRYFSSGKYELEISLPGTEKILKSFRYEALPRPAENPVVKSVCTADGPRLMIDGTPAYMLCGNVHTDYAGNPSRLHEVPVNFRTCYIKQNAADTTWIRSLNGDYDFSVIDRLAEKKLKLDPNVKLILNLNLGLPVKYATKFKDELTVTDSGHVPHDSVLCIAPFSPRFRKITRDALAALIRHCENAPYADKIGGYMLNYLETLEWLYWGSNQAMRTNAMPDYSDLARKEFRRIYGMELPSRIERLTATHGLFYDPTREQAKINANRFLSRVIAESIIDFASAVKKSMKVEKLVGVYYGYHQELGGCDWRRQLSGHNALRQVLDCGKLDFIVSPPSYSQRNLGDAGADMKPFASISQSGILPVIDDDTRTHLVPFNGYYHTHTPEQTRSIVRRNLGQYLCRRESLWLLPLTTGQEFDSPEILEDIRKFKAASEFQLRTGVQRKAEIAVVVDEESYNYLAIDSTVFPSGKRTWYGCNAEVKVSNRYVNRLTGNLLDDQRTRLARLGAPVDYLLASDIEKNIGKYKLWIFLDLFRSDEFLCHAAEKLRQSSTVLFWCYAPGVIDSQSKTFGTANMERLTGFKFRELSGSGSLEIEWSRPRKTTLLMGYPETISPRFALADSRAEVRGHYYDTGEVAAGVKRIGKSVNWFYGGNTVDAAIWRDLAREAGVHIYSETLDPLFANDRFIALHARMPGRKTIYLPRVSDVSDLFTGKILYRQVKKFSYNATLHESRIFFLGTPDELKK